MTGGSLASWRDVVMEPGFLPFHKLGHERAVFLDDYILKEMAPRFLRRKFQALLWQKADVLVVVVVTLNILLILFSE